MKLASRLPVLLLLLSPFARAHGDHGGSGSPHAQIPLPDTSDWATLHMASEHHIQTFDSGSFFSLHDYSNRGTWDSDDIERTYGLMDKATASGVPESRRRQIVHDILELYDSNRDGLISRAEFTTAFDAGKKLPDYGLGPGHHGDMEYEYEIHHFEKFHGENAREEDLTHPEDIEHFRLHDELEDEEERIADRERKGAGIVEENIPAKFRKQS